MPAVNQKSLANDTVQTWDGKMYDYMTRKSAKKLEKDGMLQITENLTAAQLKTPDQFRAAVKEFEPETLPKKYKTKVMKPE